MELKDVKNCSVCKVLILATRTLFVAVAFAAMPNAAWAAELDNANTQVIDSISHEVEFETTNEDSAIDDLSEINNDATGECKQSTVDSDNSQLLQGEKRIPTSDFEFADLDSELKQSIVQTQAHGVQQSELSQSALTAAPEGLAPDVSAAKVEASAVPTAQKTVAAKTAAKAVEPAKTTAEAAAASGPADGEYAIRSALADRSVLDVAGGSAASGANVQLYSYNATKAQRWSVKLVDKNVFVNS